MPSRCDDELAGLLLVKRALTLATAALNRPCFCGAEAVGLAAKAGSAAARPSEKRTRTSGTAQRRVMAREPSARLTPRRREPATGRVGTPECCQVSANTTTTGQRSIHFWLA